MPDISRPYGSRSRSYADEDSGSEVIVMPAKEYQITTMVDFGTKILGTQNASIKNLSEFKDEFVIVKGCSDKSVPQNAYILLTQKLQKEVKSLMFGEACSSVPLFKKKKH